MEIEQSESGEFILINNSLFNKKVTKFKIGQVNIKIVHEMCYYYFYYVVLTNTK